MNIDIPDGLAQLCKVLEIDAEAVAVEAIASTVEQAAARNAAEAENVKRRDAVAAIASTLAEARSGIAPRDRSRGTTVPLTTT